MSARNIQQKRSFSRLSLSLESNADMAGGEMETAQLSRIGKYFDRRVAIDNSFVTVCLCGSICIILAVLFMLAGGDLGGGALAAILGGSAGAVIVAALHRRTRLAALARDCRAVKSYPAEGPMRGMSSKEKP